MPISYQEQSQLRCPSCGADIEAEIWLILDAQEQPAALEQLRQGELNIVACPRCGNSGPAGAPLLFHDGAARRVIFAGAPGAAEHEVRDQARNLHALLVGAIPEELRRPYLADVDIAQDVAGVAHMLRRLERRRGGAPPPVPAAPPPLPAEAEATPPLLVAVAELLAAGSPAEVDLALAAHPLLLAPATDLTLAQLADVAVEQRAYDVAESLQQARRLLREMGEAAAGEAPAAPPELAAAGLPAAALQALLQAQSGAELLGAVDAHPLLLRPDVDGLLAEGVDLALDAGDDRQAGALEERREALAELRAARAAERAAAEAAAAPGEPEPSLEEAIEALLIAEGEDAMAEVIDQYPVLLDDVASQALWQFAAEARASGDEEMAVYAVACRDLLRRVREGLEA